MTRECLPNRRRSISFDLEHNGASQVVCVGLYDDDRPGEVFLSGAKPGSDIDGLLADLGVVLSRALQHGDTVGALAAGMGRLGDGTTPASIIGAVLDRLAAPEVAEGQGR